MGAARNEPAPSAVGADESTAPIILVVDDSLVDSHLAGAILKRELLARIVYAANGDEALKEMSKQLPALVLTDLQMPGMDGLQLVEAVRAKHPGVPTILMTANGSEELAMLALRAGAASYVPKRVLVGELAGTVENVLAAAHVERRRSRILECVTWFECEVELDNDPSLAPDFITQVQEQMVRMRICGENGKVRVGVALEEAMLNAIYHGNLELSSDLKQDGSDRFYKVAAERRTLTPYRDRKLHIQIRLTHREASFTIRDDGPGFDLAGLADPTDPENLLRASGRGLLLIRTFMDEVTHNPAGNQITMVKHVEQPN
jgi:CheY-like chemotaxis protein